MIDLYKNKGRNIYILIGANYLTNSCMEVKLYVLPQTQMQDVTVLLSLFA